VYRQPLDGLSLAGKARSIWIEFKLIIAVFLAPLFFINTVVFVSVSQQHWMAQGAPAYPFHQENHLVPPNQTVC
jgi:hypothetical protein